MGLPDGSMAEDEEIVLDLHPHWTTLLRAVLLLIVTIAVAVTAMVYVPDWGIRPQVRLGLAGAGLVVALIYSGVPFLRWSTTRYVLTNRRFTLREGILSRSGRDVPLTRIHDVSFRHNIVERLFGTGTLAVESGGERGQLVLRKIPQVERVQAELYRLMEDEDEGESRASEGGSSAR